MNSSTTYRKKLIILLSRFPYPLEKGDKLRAYNQIKVLSNYYSITLITLTDRSIPRESIEQLRSLCKTIYIFRLSPISIFFNVFFQFLTNKPFQIGYFYSNRNFHRIKSILKEVKPDHIYCQLIRVSEYVKDYHDCKKTIDFMDAFSVGIERRIEKSSKFTKWLFRSESKRLTLYERQIFEYFENHTIISEQDQQLIMHPKKNNIKIIANGVDNSFFETINKEVEYDLVFVGNMSYIPNIEAVNFISNEILPLLNTSEKKYSLFISGANPHPSIIKLAKHNPAIKISGWVNDIRSSYLKGKIFIAPMMIGTGMQNKLLEAMALGIPCITTPLANNAIKGINYESILVANTKYEFANAVQLLLNDENLYNKISENGKKLVLENFDWNKTTMDLIKLFEK